jgi:hypothetical protein
MRANRHFDTRRGRFWTVVGGVGFFSASLMFTAAARVQTVTELVSLFGGWIGATALLGLPLGWWASCQ